MAKKPGKWGGAREGAGAPETVGADAFVVVRLAPAQLAAVDAEAERRGLRRGDQTNRSECLRQLLAEAISRRGRGVDDTARHNRDTFVSLRLPAKLVASVEKDARRRGLISPSGKPNRSACVRLLLAEALA